jgi:hypothetical protein
MIGRCHVSPIRSEAVKKLGQAPRGYPKIPGNSQVSSEPVPFFHSRYAICNFMKGIDVQTLFSVLSGVLGIISLVCWILVLIKMFQNGAIGPAIASIVLILCGIGPLVALIYGWIKADEWGIRNIMLIWTVCILLSIVVGIGGQLIPRQIGI